MFTNLVIWHKKVDLADNARSTPGGEPCDTGRRGG